MRFAGDKLPFRCSWLELSEIPELPANPRRALSDLLEDFLKWSIRRRYDLDSKVGPYADRQRLSVAGRQAGIRLNPSPNLNPGSPLSSGEPRLGDVHDLEFKLIQLLNRNLDSLLFPDYIEEVIVDRIAHIVLRHVVRPNIDDVMLLDDLDDGAGYVRGIILAGSAPLEAV